jgi:hypothetical protein
MPLRWPEYVRKVGRRLLAETVVYQPALAHDRGARLWTARFVYLVPFVCTLLGLAIGSRNRRFVLACASFAAVYLLAYALVGFYVRYALPLTPIAMAACFCGLDALVWRLRAVISLRTS